MRAISFLQLLLAAALAVGSASALAEKGGKQKDFDQGPPGQAAGKGKHGSGKGSGNGDKGGRPDHPGQAGKGKGNGDAVGLLISGDERRIIHDYFRINPYPAQGLPPGVAKNLARGKPLPPGIAKRYLPPDLLGRLPARPGYEWVAVGSDIALIAIATGVIVDILSAAF